MRAAEDAWNANTQVRVQLIEILGPEGSPAWKAANVTPDKLIETVNRCNADLIFAAMSMACHLYRFDNPARDRN